MSAKPSILLDQSFPPELQAIVAEKYDVVMLEHALKMETEERAKLAGFLTYTHPRVDAVLLDNFPGLRVVANFGAGYNHIDVARCKQRGVHVSNTPGVVAEATADIAMALVLASARNVVQGHKMATSPETRSFDPNWFGVDVHGSTLGILGMGNIGFSVARRAGLGFGARILYHNRRRRPEEEEAQVGAKYVELDTLFRESDFLVLAVPVTDATKGIVNEERLRLMKPSATLVNVARGMVVDHDALVRVLQEGVIRAAALDVSEPEPLPRDHPLLKMPNVTLTPHFGTATIGTRRRMLLMTLDNLDAGMRGEVPPNRVLE